jgi:hypothetical protein
MKRQIKNANSLAKDVKYSKNGDNSILREMLFNEQKGFCAYTETYLGRTDQKDIDHFNPSKDYEERNNYLNLFLCKSQWNKEKSNKWADFQPVLSPFNDDFEKRISYNKELKLFEAADENDNEAIFLVKLLKLDDYDLSVERRKYIDLTLELMSYYETPTIYFNKVVQKNLSELKFIRSLEEEFKINIWDLIPQT